MGLIKFVAFVIFIVACVTIYHNTNSFEPKQRVIYIAVGMLVMYFITSIICAIDSKGITVNSNGLVEDAMGLMKMIFTPINAMILVSSLGNTFGKVKDKVIDTDRAGKRLIIILIAFVIVLIFETSYIGRFIEGIVSAIK